jgi:hypothetical protein
LMLFHLKLVNFQGSLDMLKVGGDIPISVSVARMLILFGKLSVP